MKNCARSLNGKLANFMQKRKLAVNSSSVLPVTSMRHIDARQGAGRVLQNPVRICDRAYLGICMIYERLAET